MRTPSLSWSWANVLRLFSRAAPLDLFSNLMSDLRSWSELRFVIDELRQRWILLQTSRRHDHCCCSAFGARHVASHSTSNVVPAQVTFAQDFRRAGRDSLTSRARLKHLCRFASLPRGRLAALE